MTDLKNGIIDLGDIAVTRETTREDLLLVYGDNLSALSTDRYVRFKRLFTVDGNQFGCGFWFDEHCVLESIELTPYIDYKSEEWDRIGQQEERRSFCDKWLYDRLGEPHKIINGDIEYTFQNIKVSCFSNFDIRDAGNAGFITVRYFDR